MGDRPMLKLDWSIESDGIVLALNEKRGALSKILRRSRDQTNFDELAREDLALALAIADLETLAEGTGESLEIRDKTIKLSHVLASKLEPATAAILGLPPPIHYTLSCDVEGIPGSTDFRLIFRWTYAGRRVLPRRQGAIIDTAEGPRLIPHWMLQAIEAAEQLS